MFKLLLVDDEPRQIQAMTNIIKQMHPDFEFYKAEDGNEALTVISNNQIDIVITDIRMPNMDGLQLSKALAQYENIKTVIISGYEEFEYARKALRFGVVDYIVKPVSKASLEEVLNRVIEKIELEHQELKLHEEVCTQLDTVLPDYLDHQLNKWVYGNLNEVSVKGLLKHIPYSKKTYVITTDLHRYKSLLSKAHTLNKLDIFDNFKNYMNQTLNQFGNSVSFFLENQSDIMVTIFSYESNSAVSSDKHFKKLNDVIDKAMELYCFNISIGISNCSSNIYENIEECFNEAMLAVNFSFFLGTGKAIEFSKLKTNKDYEKIDWGVIESSLTNLVINNNQEKFHIIVNSFFENIMSNGYFNPQQLKESIKNIIISITKKAEFLALEENYNEFIEEIKSSIFECEDYLYLKNIVRRILQDIITKIASGKKNSSYNIIQNCKKYIDEHYMEDISLEFMANKYHFNTSYFSNMFKTMTKMNFSDYLTSIRIKKSQSLLKTTDYKILDICRIVGYKDAAYFNTTFKKYLGISPHKYRQMSIHEEASSKE